jgi:hypothetical protein
MKEIEMGPTGSATAHIRSFLKSLRSMSRAEVLHSFCPKAWHPGVTILIPRT